MTVLTLGCAQAKSGEHCERVDSESEKMSEREMEREREELNKKKKACMKNWRKKFCAKKKKRNAELRKANNRIQHFLCKF